MTYAEDPHYTVFQSKQDTIVPEAESKRSCHVAMQCFDVTDAGTGETKNAVKQMHRYGANRSRERRQRLRQATRCDKAALPEIVRRGLNLRKNFFHRNALAAAFGEPEAAFAKTAPIVVRYRLIVGCRRRNGAGDRIDHHFKEIADRRQLTWIELIQQPVGMLFIHNASQPQMSFYYPALIQNPQTAKPGDNNFGKIFTRNPLKTLARSRRLRRRPATSGAQYSRMMTRRPFSEARAAASRANGAKSRGPVTGQGKSHSSKNSLRHGLRALDPFAAQESDKTWIALHARFVHELKPRTEHERDLVKIAASAHWRRLSLWPLEKSILNGEMLRQNSPTSEGNMPVALRAFHENTSSLEILGRMESRFSRTAMRAQNLLHELRRAKVLMRSEARRQNAQNRKQNINERTPELAENTDPFFGQAQKTTISDTKIPPIFPEKPAGLPKPAPDMPMSAEESPSPEPHSKRLL
jgi:hypothetical protein